MNDKIRKTNYQRLVTCATVLVFMLASCDDLLQIIDTDSSALSGAKLISLSVDIGELSPAFDPLILEYGIDAGSGIAAVKITAIKEKAGARIDVSTDAASWIELSSGVESPSLNLLIGMNRVSVRVTAEDEITTRIYTVNIHRLSPESSLSALSVGGVALSPTFSPDSLEYACSVANAVTSISVGATTLSPAATVAAKLGSEADWHIFASGGISPELALDVGDNPVEVRVLAENGVDETTYAITVHRKSADATLSSLETSAGALSPTFGSGTTTYNLDVGSAVSSFTITPTATEPHASIEAMITGGTWIACGSGAVSVPFSLPSDDCAVSVRVTAEDGSPQVTYSISVHRKSGDADLAGLVLSPIAFSPAFSPAVTKYFCGVGASDVSVGVTPTKDHALASIGVRLNEGAWNPVASGGTQSLSLVAGTNVIEVKVVAEDAAVSKTYAVKVVKPCPGAIDLTFKAFGSNPGVGGSVAVRAMSVQTDGKIIIAGDFASYDGVSRTNLARLNSDGSLDAAFAAAGTGLDGTVLAMAVQPDGKILIAGSFTAFSGTARGRIARLNADGTLDTGFLTTGAGANALIRTIALQGDGKIVIGGDFTSFNGTVRSRLARLNADGSLDTGFLASGAGVGDGSGGSGQVHDAVIQSDGKIIIVGYFATYNGTARGNVARVNADGTLDATFLATGAGANESVSRVVLQSDGKALIAGWFSTYNGLTNRGRFIRLNTDGQPDTSFIASNTGIASGSVYSIKVQSTGMILIGGHSPRTTVSAESASRASMRTGPSTPITPPSGLRMAMTRFSPSRSRRTARSSSAGSSTCSTRSRRGTSRDC